MSSRSRRKHNRNPAACAVTDMFNLPFLVKYAPVVLPALRVFRDKYLAEYSTGRKLIKLYYSGSKLLRVGI